MLWQQIVKASISDVAAGLAKNRMKSPKLDCRKQF